MIVGEISKNSMERIRVSTESYKGHDFVDIRIYYEDANKEWRPSRKGIAIAHDKVDELIELLRKAQQ